MRNGRQSPGVSSIIQKSIAKNRPVFGKLDFFESRFWAAERVVYGVFDSRFLTNQLHYAIGFWD